jgi:hypothetical protein
LNKLSEDTNIIPTLIEKDYWLMHVLYGLKLAGYVFELKGGTSISKGYHIIDRFSEDIDIYIHPQDEFADIETNLHKVKKSHIQKRKDFYDYLANSIKIEGIIKIERDVLFDNQDTYKSGGIRLYYDSLTEEVEGIKQGILLEAGFDDITPNEPLTLSSWAYDKAAQTSGIEIIDNRAKNIPCYHPGYTFIEKMQTIATKFRNEQESGKEGSNLMRQYYDLYSLLSNQKVLDFIDTEEYHKHKIRRFPKKDFEIPTAKNEAFVLNNLELRERFRKRYEATKSLYYKGQPAFDDVLMRIRKYLKSI